MKTDLAGRVFGAWGIDIPDQHKAEERASRIHNKKSKLLQTASEEFPDPSTLKNEWLCESESISSWPPLFLSDIAIFLMADHPGKDVDVHKRISFSGDP